MKRKKDRRIHISTLRVLAVSLLIGVVALTFSYTSAWGTWMDKIDETASADVFVTYETETIYGEAFTNQNVSGAKVIAYNVWETT